MVNYIEYTCEYLCCGFQRPVMAFLIVAKSTSQNRLWLTQI